MPAQRESKYLVALMSNNGEWIDSREADTIKEAKEIARRYLTDDFPIQHWETTHATLGTHKVEVYDRNEDCVYDLFLVNH